jgi:hypothetical protein
MDDESMQDLKHRLQKVGDELRDLAIQASSKSECTRLLSKREGVMLALSYLQEC